jgi:K+-transporting ATPase KdpF subunit
MSAEMLLGALIVAALTAYLLYALFNPNKF